MVFSRGNNRAEKHEAKGDKLRGKKMPRAALEEYRKSAELAPDRIAIYEKLEAALNEAGGNWTEEDFTASVSWAMKRQELLDPAFKRLNARHDPEFQEVVKLAKGMLTATTRDGETDFVEKIVARGLAALYPLIDLLLAFKAAGRKGGK